MEIQYDERTDAMLSAIAAKQLAPKSVSEWLKLAMACLDQAGVSAYFSRRLQRIIRAELWLEEFGTED